MENSTVDQRPRPDIPSGTIRLAIIANAPTPYRTHLHTRIAQELKDIELWSVYTHGISNAPWRAAVPQTTRPVWFGTGETTERQAAPSAQLHEWRKGGRIIRWLKEQGIAAVVIHGYNDLGRFRIIRWCSNNGIPCLLAADSNILNDQVAGLRAWIKRRYVGWVVQQCAGLLPCGSLGRDYFVKYGASPERIHFFPYEPDYHLIQTLPQERVTAVSLQLGLSHSRRRLIYSGRLVDLKRVDLLVDAFVEIAPQRQDWDLVLLGDGPMRKSLKARVPSALVERVHWLGFIDDQEVISAVYRACDILVQPSELEPWAVVVSEAVAGGLAVISSNAVGAAAELVRDGVNGAVFASGDGLALREKLLLATSQDVTDQMKAQSRRVFEDWRRFADPVTGLRRALCQTMGAMHRSHIVGEVSQC